jgi:hypothetical protein
LAAVATREWVEKIVLPELYVRYRTVTTMLSPDEITKLKAEIQRLETASQVWTDSGIKQRIDEMIRELKKKLATETMGPSDKK